MIAILIESTEVIIISWANNQNKSRLSLIIETNHEPGYSQCSSNQIQTTYHCNMNPTDNIVE